jgi:hypothetical protein
LSRVCPAGSRLAGPNRAGMDRRCGRFPPTRAGARSLHDLSRCACSGSGSYFRTPDIREDHAAYLVLTCETSRKPLPHGCGSETVAEPRALASGFENRTYANFCNLALGHWLTPLKEDKHAIFSRSRVRPARSRFSQQPAALVRRHPR